MSAASATRRCEPFISTNIDFGAEYYTGQEGYIGIAAFQKDVTGFTVNGNVTVPFSALARVWRDLRHAVADPAG